jgi:hypothetical protein
LGKEREAMEVGRKERSCKECWISLRKTKLGARVAEGDLLLSRVGDESKGGQSSSSRAAPVGNGDKY